MTAGAILPAIPFDVEGSTAPPGEPLLPCFLAGTHITMADGSHTGYYSFWRLQHWRMLRRAAAWVADGVPDSSTELP